MILPTGTQRILPCNLQIPRAIVVAHRGGVPFPRDTSTGAGAIILLFAFAACVVAVVYTCCGGWVGAGNESDEKEDMIQGGNLDHSVLTNGSLSGSVQSNGSVGSQDDVGVEWGSGRRGRGRVVNVRTKLWPSL